MNSVKCLYIDQMIWSIWNGDKVSLIFCNIKLRATYNQYSVLTLGLLCPTDIVTLQSLEPMARRALYQSLERQFRNIASEQIKDKVEFELSFGLIFKLNNICIFIYNSESRNSLWKLPLPLLRTRKLSWTPTDELCKNSVFSRFTCDKIFAEK